jgi:hypothetical protein
MRATIAIVSSVVVAAGLAFVIAGAFSTPPVALEFCGYRTNVFDEVRNVSALFCLSNGSPREIVCQAPSAGFHLRLASKTTEGWIERTRFLCSIDSESRNLRPSQAVNFSVFHTNSTEPLRACVDFTYVETGNTPWHRVLRRVRRSQTNRSASVVIQGS